MNTQEAYMTGFCKTAEAYGVDPELLLESAGIHMTKSAGSLNPKMFAILNKVFAKTPLNPEEMRFARSVAKRSTRGFKQKGMIAQEQMLRNLKNAPKPESSDWRESLRAGTRSILDSVGNSPASVSSLKTALTRLAAKGAISRSPLLKYMERGGIGFNNKEDLIKALSELG